MVLSFNKLVASRATETIDSIDLGIVGRLARDGRATWADLSEEFGLTAPAIAARVRRLVDRGVIRQFSATVNPTAVGAVTAFVEATLSPSANHEEFRQAMTRLVAVQECHRVAGAAQYLLKVRERSSQDVDTPLASVLPKAAPEATVRVAMVLQTIKETPVFPLPR